MTDANHEHRKSEYRRYMTIRGTRWVLTATARLDGRAVWTPLPEANPRESWRQMMLGYLVPVQYAEFFYSVARIDSGDNEQPFICKVGRN